MEFFESYHLVERTWTPEQPLRPAESEELILEPFHESLEIHVDNEARVNETILCQFGALSPMPEEQHPAISHRGLDFLGQVMGAPHRVVLGVAQASKDETPFLLLLRALNCFAELAPPLRVAQLGHELFGAPLSEDVYFDLHLVVNERVASPEWNSLVELSRDMAEVFICQVGEYRQFEGTLGRIACVETDPEDIRDGIAVRPIWEV